MSRKLWRTTFSLVLVLAVPCVAWAQEIGPVLEADPEGAYFHLKGPLSVSGHPPVSLNVLAEGVYSVDARGPGLAAARSRLRVGDNGIQFEGWAGPGALAKPAGLLHLRRGDKRGWYHLGATSLAATFWILKQRDLQDSRTELDEAEQKRALATDPSDIARFDRDADEAKRAIVDDRRLRNIWAGVAVASQVMAGVEAWLLTPQLSVRSSADGTFTARVPRVDRWQVAWRSALSPGSGQRYVGENGRGVFFASLFALSGAGTLLSQDAYLAARRDVAAAKHWIDDAQGAAELARATSELRDAERDERRYSTMRWVFLGTTAYIYAWNIFDASNLAGRIAAVNSFSVDLTPTVDGASLSLSWALP